MRMKERISSNKKTLNKDSEITSILQINQQYYQLLQKLSQRVVMKQITIQPSPQAHLFETYQNLKDLNRCMKQQLKLYDQFCNPVLDTFLKQNNISNSCNLISQYEQTKQEIQNYRQKLYQMGSDNSQDNRLNDLQREQRGLEQELNRLTNERIHRQNKREIISSQLELGQDQLKKIRNINLISEMQLRRIEKSKQKQKK